MRFLAQGDSELCSLSPCKPAKTLFHESFLMLLFNTSHETPLWGRHEHPKFPVLKEAEEEAVGRKEGFKAF